MQKKKVADPLGICYNNLRGCVRGHVICRICSSENWEKKKIYIYFFMLWHEISVKEGWAEIKGKI